MAELIVIDKYEANNPMLINTYIRLVDKVTSVENVELQDDIVSQVLNSSFNFGNSLKISGKIFLHLLIYSYFVEMENSENEKAEIQLVATYIQKHEGEMQNELKKMAGMTFITPEVEKARKILINIYKYSGIVFAQLFERMSKATRKSIMEITSKNFNNFNIHTPLDPYIYEKGKVGEKIRLIAEKVDIIFKDISMELKNVDFNDENIEKHMTNLIKDAIMAVYINLCLENTESSTTFKMYYNDNAWFIYFYSILMEKYVFEKTNLLKCKEDASLLKYGATLSSVNKILAEYQRENKIELSPDANAKLFYLLLGIGMFEKTIFSEYSDKTTIPLSLNLKYNDNQEITIDTHRVNNRYSVIDFVNMLITSDNYQLQNYLSLFNKNFEQNIKEMQSNDLETIARPLDATLTNLFQNIDLEMVEKYSILKNEYDNSNEKKKKAILHELINTLAYMTNKTIENKKNKDENLGILFTKLKEENNFSIKLNFIESLGKNIFLSDNIFDIQRREAEEKIKKINNSMITKIKKLIEFFPEETSELNIKEDFKISPKGDEPESEVVEYIKKEMIKKLKIKSKIIFTIYSGIELSEVYDNETFIPRTTVLEKIFYMSVLWKKISEENLIKKYEKNTKMFFEILTDVVYFINLKENKNVYNVTSIRDNEYIDIFYDRTYEYFQSNFYSSSDKEKEYPEAKEMLELFKDALLTGFNYYDSTASAKSQKLSRKDLEQENSNYSKYIDSIIDTFNLEQIFIEI